MELGNIIYLHLFDIEPIILVTQELKADRFCKVIDITPIKGGKEGEQYLNYKVQSLFTNKIYEINNYIGPYSGISIEAVEEIINNHKNDFVEQKLEDMLYLIEKVKDMIK